MSLVFTQSSSPAGSSGATGRQKSLLFWRNLAVSCVLLLAGFSTNVAKAQLTIGSGSATANYNPIYTYYGYNYTQSTYLASEIVAAGATAGTPGFISSISFNATSYMSDFGTKCPDWVVYLGNTSKTTFSGTTDWIPSTALTKVFTGTASCTGTGWFKITFPTAFYWDGTSNLVVAIDENTAGYTSSGGMTWLGTSRTGNRSIYFYNDGTNPDPVSPPSANSVTNITADIKIDYTPAVACSGTTVGGTASASSTTLCPGTSVALSVTGSTAATGLTYDWESSTSGTGPFSSVGGTATSFSTTPPGGTTTYYRRKTTCTSTGSSAYSTIVAVTVSAVLSPPYSENFESVTPGNNALCATASPSFSSGVTVYSGYDNWKVIADATTPYASSSRPGGSNYLIAGYNIGTYIATADYWFSPGLNLTAGKTYRFSYWHRMGDYAVSSYSGGFNHGMYIANAPSKSATYLTAIKPDINGTSNSSYVQNVGDFTVPTSGVYYAAIKANNTNFGGYYCAGTFDDLNLIELPACNTATSATFGKGGTAIASPNVMCSIPSTTTLSVTGTPPFSGLSFSWEMATGSTGSGFPTVVGSTATYPYSITAAGVYYFRCKITCTATGLTTYSDTVKVTTTPITPPYTEDFEGGNAGTNMPCAGSSYWGSAPSYWNLSAAPYIYGVGIKNHTTGGAKYLHAGYVLGAVSTGADEYWFTPGLALTAAKAYNVSFWYSNAAYSTSYSTVGTTIGVAAGTTQSRAGMTIAVGDDTTVYNNAVMTATYNQLNRGFIAPTTNTYYVGIKVNNSGYSYYGMAVDDIGITQLPPCSAKPTAGTAVASPALICSTGTSTISLKGVSIASDLSFQWDSSLTGLPGSWTSIVGANLPAYTSGTLSVGPVYYRCRVTCAGAATPNTDTSAPAKVSVGALDLPYSEDFEAATVGVNVPCAAVAGTWNATSLLYWSLRSGDYSTSYPGIKNHTAGGKKYLYSGYYNGPYYSTGDQFFWMTPALKMTGGKAYQVGIWYNGAGYSTGTNGLKIGIYAGTTQSAAGMTIRAGGVDTNINGAGGMYSQFARSFIAPTTGNYYVGIKTVHSGYNYPGMVIDDININVMPDCTGKPVAGKADALPDVICTTGTTRLRLSGTTVSSGIKYKWEESTTGLPGSFTASTAGTGATTGDYLTGTLSAARYYRCVVTCATSGLSDTSSIILINVGAITPPYREDFEKVFPGTNANCASFSSTFGTATSTTNWTTKGFPYTAYGMVHNNHTPGGSNYLWGGYYLGYSPAAGAMWFTPAIKLIKDSTYEFSYWYEGPGYYYYNSSVELGMFYGTAQTEAAMTTQIRPYVTDKVSDYKQLIGRFKSIGTGNYYMGIKVRHTYTYSYYGTSIDDIGLDQLTPCAGKPTAGDITALPHMLCSTGTVALDMDYTKVSKSSGLTYRWEWTTTDPTSGPFIALGSSAVLSAPNLTTPSLTTTTWFRCVVKCNFSGDSTMSDVLKVDVGIVQPPYIQTFETVAQGVQAPCASNTNTFSPSSWLYWGVYRVPVSTAYPAMNNHTAGGTAYLMAGYYLGYPTATNEYWFTPRIQLTGGKLYQFSYWYNGSGYAGGKTTLSAAYGTTNTAAGMTTVIGTPAVDVNTLTYKQYTGQFAPPTSGAYYIGVRVNHTGTYTYPGVAIDDIGLQEVPPCSSKVVAGTITSDPIRVCAISGTTVLDLSGSTLATGLTYTWEAKVGTGAWTTVGTTAPPYTTDPLVGNTWFRCTVKCTASGASSMTPEFYVPVGAYDVPYKEDFEGVDIGAKPICSDATYWGLYDYDGFKVKADPAYQGAYNNTPGGKKYMAIGYYLGVYSTYSPLINDNFWFTPGVNLDTRYKYDFQYYYVGQSTSIVKFSSFMGKSQSVGGMTIPLQAPTSPTGSYQMYDTTFRPASNGVYYFGFKKTTSPLGTYSASNMGIDDINVNYAPCDGMPFVGTTSSKNPSGTGLCLNTPVTLTHTGATVRLVPGIRHQWQRKSMSGTGPLVWSNIIGATDTVISADTLVGYEYRLAVVCTNTNDSVFSASFQIPALPPHPPVTITPSSTPLSYCAGDTIKFSASNFPSAVYDWMLDSVVIPGWKFSDLGAIDPGVYMVKVTSPLSPCPAWSNKVKAIENDPGYTVSITKPADSIVCAGTSVTLTATSSKPGVTYQWRRNNVNISSATTNTLLADKTGYYRVMVYDGSSSCAAASRTILITVKPNPPAIISVPGGTLTACEGEGVVLNANTGGYSYEWLRGGSTVVGWNDSTQWVNNSGVYAVKVRSSDGCVSVSKDVTVSILPAPVPVVSKSVSGTVVTLSTTPGYASYQWYRNGVKVTSPIGTLNTLTPLALNGLYTVRVTASNNCEGESTPIKVDENFLSIGNVNFNEDQIKIYPNPTQAIVNIESPIEVKVSVKDVTGKVIFESKVTKQVDLGKFADGVYLFTISDKEGNELIKQQRVSKITNK